jgi:hypothetical protein
MAEAGVSYPHFVCSLELTRIEVFLRGIARDLFAALSLIVAETDKIHATLEQTHVLLRFRLPCYAFTCLR